MSKVKAAKKQKGLYSNAKEAQAALASKKDELSAAKEELKAFEKENKLSKVEDKGAHEKHGKKWSKLNEVVENLENSKKEIESWLKDNKPKGEKKGGFKPSGKYDYPEGLSEAEKKKFRAKARAAAKREEKGSDSKKAAKKSATPKEEGKKSKKGKDKKSKKEKAAKSED